MSELMDKIHEGQRLSFIQLFRDFDLSIEIPIIQRDYAQGRPEAREVRTTFLQALFDYLASNRPCNDLDFVYGSVSTEQKFIPLDGQQRLTTLFLLHWYLAISASEQQGFSNIICRNKCSRFSYETRSSSREFCDALVTNPFNYQLIKDRISENEVSAVIKDQPWFFRSWCFDPTIQAMLNMLDDIHLKFRGYPEFYKRLTSQDSPVITFRFLNLNKFSLTDDLYIKMNARGKPLTPFENFKAKLEQKIQSFREPWPSTYRLPFKTGEVSGYDYFIHKIDNEWADVFWPFRNTASSDDTFDDELMNFIGLFIAQNFSLRPGSIDNSAIHSLFFDGAKVKRLSLDDYDKSHVLSQSLLKKLIELLDLLSASRNQEFGITLYLPENPYYQEVDIFKKVLSNSTSYPEKLRFFAFYSAIANGKRDQELLEWMRVVFNLTEHPRIVETKDYIPALVSLHELLRHQTPILDLLRDNIEITAFSKSQIFEEKLKAHLLQKSREWRSDILHLEQHATFQGQIGFVLKFAGVVDYFLNHNNVAWEAFNSSYHEKFKFYASSASETFSALTRGSKAINYAWERAVLCKGIYFIPKLKKINEYNMLHSTSADNARRDYSWYRLLRLSLVPGDDWDEKQGFVKQVFDDPLFDPTDVIQSLENICSATLNTEKLDEKNWRHLLIVNPSIFDVSEQGFVALEKQTLILMHQSQRNHNHSEIVTYFYNKKLQEESFDIAPFKVREYTPQRGHQLQAKISIKWFEFRNAFYTIGISYADSCFNLSFYIDPVGEKRPPFSTVLKNQLCEFGFSMQKVLGFEVDVFELSYPHFFEVKSALLQLCQILKGLPND